MNYRIGIDIGATKINFVLLRKQRILKKKKILTPGTKEEIIEAIEENIRCLTWNIKQKEVEGIGIGIPGPLNEKGDLVLNPPNLKCLSNCPLAKIIEKDLKTRTLMDNDVNCFTLGEAVMGAGKEAKFIVGITLGSGVGGGIVAKLGLVDETRSRKHIYRGAFGSAAEVGHMTIKFDGLKCSCGGYGCFEEYCSERFFKRKGILPLKLEEKAEKSNKFALNLYNEYGRYLGIGLANIINLLDPEMIVIGGGISVAYPFFIKSAKAEIKKRVISPLSKQYVKIKRAKLGDLAGSVGAALLVKS